MQPRLADFYVPSIIAETIELAQAAAIANRAWPLANRAIYVPCIFPYPCTLRSVSIVCTGATGNYDLGFYDGYSKLKLASSGSTALSAAGAKTLTFSPQIRVDAGRVYYAGVALSSVSGTLAAWNTAIAILIATGFGQQATALPLPSTMAPATIASAYMPLVIFGIQ